MTFRGQIRLPLRCGSLQPSRSNRQAFLIEGPEHPSSLQKQVQYEQLKIVWKDEGRLTNGFVPVKAT